MNKLAKLGITALCGILFAVSLTACGGKKKDAPEPVPKTETTAEKESYDITGSWYSDREKGDTLTLNKDGSYTSSVWLKDGNYSISENTLTLTDLLGKETSLTIKENGDNLTLVYSDSSSGHTYYRTEEALNAVKVAQESAAAEEQSFNESVVMKILTTGDWTSNNGFTLHITKNDFTVSRNENNPNFNKEYNFTPDKTYQYQITDIKKDSNVSAFFINITTTADDDTQKQAQFTIGIKEDNLYTFFSDVVPYAAQFTKTVKIDFDTPMTNATEEITLEESSTAPEPPTIAHIDPETDSSKERVIVNEDGSIERIRQIRRTDKSGTEATEEN